MKNIVLTILTSALLAATAFSDGTKDETAVMSVLTRLQTAWNTGDARAWANEFAPEADFTVWSGLRVRGREAIFEGHEMIFKGPYKGTTLTFSVDGVRWIRPDVAIVLTKGATPGGKEGDEMKQTFVISKHGKAWLIDVFQNTKVQPWTPPSKD